MHFLRNDQKWLLHETLKLNHSLACQKIICELLKILLYAQIRKEKILFLPPKTSCSDVNPYVPVTQLVIKIPHKAGRTTHTYNVILSKVDILYC